MNTLFASVRAVHYASAILLFGELVFVLAVARLGWHPARTVGPGGSNDLGRRLLLVARWAVVAGVVSGLAWLAIAAAVMTDAAIEQAMNRHTLELVLGKTAFGQVWVLRFGLLVAYCFLLAALKKASLDRVRLRLMIGMLLLAAAYLAALAWCGHAAAGQAPDGDVQIAFDVVHVLASGAWLGALPGLVYLLGRARPLAEAAQAARRFSALGVLCVVLLIASGLTNAWFLVGDIPALIGTSYGRLLLVKLALFGAMLVLAIANRWYLSVRLAREDPAATRLLRRNAIMEIAAGTGVLIIVGALGVTVPAAHQTPIWPFDHALSWNPVVQTAWLSPALVVATATACIAAGAVLKGLRRRRARQWLAGLAGIAAPAAIAAWLLAVPAYPTTYVESPVGYTTKAIVHGAELHAAECRTCHGPRGRGDGPAGRSVPVRPTDLADLASQHPEGNLFWWIARGIPGTPMPGFAPRLSDRDIWSLIQFLHAQAEARDAPAVTHRVQAMPSMTAPDFTFEMARRPQEWLRQLRDNRMVLLVFYTPPQSLPRLRELAGDERVYAAAGARIIALPLAPSSIAADVGTTETGGAILANAGADVAAAYTMFARPPAGTTTDDVPAHVEFLIDRQGDLRVRWTGVAPEGINQTKETLDRIEILNREPLRQAAQGGHGHRR